MSASRWRSAAPAKSPRFRQTPWLRKDRSVKTTEPPLGRLLNTITLDSLGSTTNNSEARIKDCEAVASFNLLEKPAVAIAIPGLPPRWTPLPDSPTLKEDSDVYYRDVNAAHNPHGPWHATVETIMRQTDVKPFQLLVCGSTLGNLFRFASGKPKTCRMLVTETENVVCLTRRENTPMEEISGVFGYGHTFPEAYTSWNKTVKGSTSHQRISRYTFAGIGIIVRFEADGYLPDKLSAKQSMDDEVKNQPGADASMDDLESAFAALDHKPATATRDDDLKIREAGFAIPQHAVFDLKTRSIRRKLDDDDILLEEIPRLWVRQVPNFILAFHERGRFTDINVKDIGKDIQDWEDTHQPELSRLAELLRRIIAAVQGTASGKLEIRMEEGKPDLCMHEQLSDAPALFPPATAAKWEEWLQSRSVNADNGALLDEKSGEDDAKSGTGVSDQYQRLASQAGDTERDTDARDLTVCDDECNCCGSCK